MVDLTLPRPANTPKTLHNLSVLRVAQMLLESAVPPNLKKNTPLLNMFGYLEWSSRSAQSDHNEHDTDCPQLDESGAGDAEDRKAAGDICDNIIDNIILAEAGESCDHLLEAKELLLEYMMGVKQWWDDEGWFGKPDSKLRREVRLVCSDLLDVLGSRCLCPLLWLTFELMFSSSAGHGKMHRAVPSKLISSFKKFLLKLQPFGIEKLYTNNLKFDCPSVLMTICKHSPLMRWIHLKIEFALGDVLRDIGYSAPNIETVVIVVREYELYEKISSTVEIVIVGGEGLEDNLYKGFFDGWAKNDVKQKIQTGESIKLSFPKLKYIDVGSHRDVREFLHHLLYLYPDIRSITCDSENWMLSKYSLDFPIMTPSTLGNGPVSLQGKVISYDLHDMSFSSFCLASKLHNIIERYKRLKYVSLHLLKGPWKIKSTSDTAKELLDRIKCQYLTICVDVYMSKEDLLSLYTPALLTVGSSLRILQFHLTNEVNVGVLCQLISMCCMLEELSLVSSCERCEVEGEEDDHIHVHALTKLKCLSISSHYNVTSALYRLSQKLILAATNLTTLELELGGRNISDWLLNIATSGSLMGLKILRLDLPGCTLDKSVMTSLLFPMINVMPRLSCLMLGCVCDCVFLTLKAKYQWSQLRIIKRCSPYVAFRNLSSKSCSR